MPFRSRSRERPRPPGKLVGIAALAVATLAVVAASAVALTSRTWLAHNMDVIYPIVAAVFVAGVALLILSRPGPKITASSGSVRPIGQTRASGSGEAYWPDYLSDRAPDPEPATTDQEASDPRPAGVVAGVPDLTVPARVSVTPSAPDDAATPPETALSPVALRILGAQRSSAQLAQLRDVAASRHRVALGDYWIDVVLAETPPSNYQGKWRTGHSWLAETPYLAWAPLPHDVPEGGVAFVCIGAWDEGCLFIDLAAAPGAISVGGDRVGAGRLADSIAHQLSVAAAADHPSTVIAVGAALPQPLPAGARWIQTLADLTPTVNVGVDAGPEVVFCELTSNEEAFALARYINGASRRVIPIIVANLPRAPWSFTAQPMHPRGDGQIA